MDKTEAEINAAQILTTLFNEYGGTLQAILDDIDMADHVFKDTVLALDADAQLN